MNGSDLWPGHPDSSLLRICNEHSWEVKKCGTKSHPQSRQISRSILWTERCGVIHNEMASVREATQNHSRIQIPCFVFPKENICWHKVDILSVKNWIKAMPTTNDIIYGDICQYNVEDWQQNAVSSNDSKEESCCKQSSRGATLTDAFAFVSCYTGGNKLV